MKGMGLAKKATPIKPGDRPTQLLTTTRDRINKDMIYHDIS